MKDFIKKWIFPGLIVTFIAGFIYLVFKKD